MQIKTKTLVWIEDERGRKFDIGDDIGFDYKGERYIGIIKNITDREVEFGKVVYRGKDMDYNMIVEASEISKPNFVVYD